MNCAGKTAQNRPYYIRMFERINFRTKNAALLELFLFNVISWTFHYYMNNFHVKLFQFHLQENVYSSLVQQGRTKPTTSCPTISHSLVAREIFCRVFQLLRQAIKGMKRKIELSPQCKSLTLNSYHSSIFDRSCMFEEIPYNKSGFA